MNPKVGTLKDIDEGRAVQMREKQRRNCVIPILRTENVILKFVSNVKTQHFETAECA